MLNLMKHPKLMKIIFIYIFTSIRDYLFTLNMTNELIVFQISVTKLMYNTLCFGDTKLKFIN